VPGSWRGRVVYPATSTDSFFILGGGLALLDCGCSELFFLKGLR